MLAFGVFESETSTEFKSFLAASLKSNLVCAHTFSAAIGAKHGLTAPGVMLFNKARGFISPPSWCNGMQDRSSKVAYGPKWTYGSYDKFYDRESVPIVHNYTAQASFVHANPVKVQLLLFIKLVRS